MRSYTVREQRRTPGGADEVDIDFVLHGDSSPASRWAGKAVTGRRIMAIGPAVAENKSVRFQPPAGTDAVLMYADETALPAAAAILDRLPRRNQGEGLVRGPARGRPDRPAGPAGG